MAPDAGLAKASRANAVAAVTHFTRTSGGTVRHDGGILLAASPDPYCGTFHNAAIRTDRAADPARVLRAADDFFARRGRGYILWVLAGEEDDLEDRARAAGMTLRRPAGGAADMAITRAFPPAAPTREVSLAPVTDADEAEVFARIVASAYAHREEPAAATGSRPDPAGAVVADGEPQPASAALAMFGRPGALLGPGAYAVMARLDGQPASCAMHYHHGEVAGVYWVSTIPEARRHGLAEIVTREVVNEGFRRGAQAAILQASSMGESLYRGMGFTVVSRHRRYIRAAPADAHA